MLQLCIRMQYLCLPFIIRLKPQIYYQFTTLTMSIGTGNSPSYLQQGKLTVIPNADCQAWHRGRWAEIFPYNLPYEPPALEHYHVCAGSGQLVGIEACYVSMSVLVCSTDLVKIKEIFENMP